jgi:hypothetical protein
MIARIFTEGLAAISSPHPGQYDSISFGQAGLARRRAVLCQTMPRLMPESPCQSMPICANTRHLLRNSLMLHTVSVVDPQRALLKHFLAAIAYRTQKAVRGSPDSFADFRAGLNVRTPRELLWHMTGVLGYARTFFTGGVWQPDKLETFSEELQRFHQVLEDLGRLMDTGILQREISPERLLQGPLADVTTHAGQLAMLRRLAGFPVPPENFIRAAIHARQSRSGATCACGA